LIPSNDNRKGDVDMDRALFCRLAQHIEELGLNLLKCGVTLNKIYEHRGALYGSS